MGNRCYFEVICRRTDMERFLDLGQGFEYGDDIPFVGWHDSGDENNGAVFACDGKGFACTEGSPSRMRHRRYVLVVANVEMRQNGTFEPAMLRRAKRLHAMWKRAEKVLGMLRPKRRPNRK